VALRQYIEAGRLRDRITISAPATAVNGSQDAYGEIISAANPPIIAENVPAMIEFVGGKQVYTAETYMSQVTHRVTIRWMPGLLPQQGVTFTDQEGRLRQLQIMFVDNPDQRNRMLILNCLERDLSVRVDLTTTVPLPSP
jgi:head-tail adaptor